MPKELTTTKLPSGSKEFFEAISRLENAGPDCNNKFEMANYCCKLCTKANASNCEDCYVQTVGDLNDPYRKKIEENSRIFNIKLLDHIIIANNKYISLKEEKYF